MNPLPVSLPFTDRSEAGRRLAERLRAYTVTDPIVLALPRGGVPVGAELARYLRIPMDVLMVRKIGMPGHQETGVGAITEDGHVSFDDRALARMRMPRETLSTTVEAERAELTRRLEVYRGARAAPRLTGRDVIVVDDGVATGGTARAALRMVRRQRPARLVLAIPVGSQQAVEMLRPEVEDLVVLTVPENFRAVGEWYRDFGQLSDGDVTAVLTELRAPAAEVDSERAVRIRAGDVYLEGELATPPEVRAGVVFALTHGRHDPRQRAIATSLRQSGYATLLFDLLTHDEWRRESDEGFSGVDTAGLDKRLQAAVRWLRRATDLANEPVGLFGSGAAAPAVLMTAAARPEDVAAVVVHGGRIDTAEESLPEVRAPALVLVEGTDSLVRELTEWALGRLGGPYDLRVMPGVEQFLGHSEAWHEVGAAAAGWFGQHL